MTFSQRCNGSPRAPIIFLSRHDSFTSPLWHRRPCSGTLNRHKHRLASQGGEREEEGWRVGVVCPTTRSKSVSETSERQAERNLPCALPYLNWIQNKFKGKQNILHQKNTLNGFLLSLCLACYTLIFNDAWLDVNAQDKPSSASAIHLASLPHSKI